MKHSFFKIDPQFVYNETAVVESQETDRFPSCADAFKYNPLGEQISRFSRSNDVDEFLTPIVSLLFLEFNRQ